MKRETAGGIGDRFSDDSFTLETTTIATSWADGEGSRSARHFLDVQLSPWGQASSGLTGAGAGRWISSSLHKLYLKQELSSAYLVNFWLKEKKIKFLHLEELRNSPKNNCLW